MDIGPTISGIDTASAFFDTAGAQIAAGSVTPGADLTDPLVKLTLAGVAIDVNARVLQAQQQTTQSVIDMVA
jgi:hypothetical protein